MNARIVLTGIAAVAAGHAAIAGITATYSGPNSFSVKITGMTDFDQRRTTLPANGGMYCAPTSAMNIFGYAANHGFPEVSPGQGNWQSQANYPLATLFILITGNYMGTDPTNGTSGGGSLAGVQTIINLTAKDKLCVQAMYPNGSDFLRLHQLAQQVALGGLVNFAYGRYSLVGNSGGTYELAIDGEGKLVRDGGHVITLDGAGINEPFAPLYATSRDPATPNTADAMQSTFESRYTDVFSLLFRGGPSGAPFSADTMYWDPATTSGTIRLIDGGLVLRPCGALRFTAIEPGVLRLSMQAAGSFGISPASVDLAGAFGMADLAFSADGLQAIALVRTSLTGGATQLRRVELATGAQSPIGTMTTLRGIAVGRDGHVYAHDGTSVLAYRPDGSLAASYTPPGAPAALAYDDARDRVVVLSVARRTVTALSRSLAPVAEVVIPAAIPMSGAGSVTAAPADGAVFFVTGGSNSIGRVGPGMTAADVTLSAVTGVTGPQRIAAGDGGRLWLTSQGSIRALEQDSQGRWVQDPGSPFHLLADQGPLAILRSRTNYDPALHAGPAWRELTVAEVGTPGVPVAGCGADLDANGRVDGADLGMMLSGWGATTATAVSVSFDYVGNAAGSWASDMVLSLSDGVHPPVAWGGYDSLLGGAVDGGEWPFYGAGSAASGSYSATVQLPPGAVLSGAGPWSVTVGNGWNASPTVQYRNVRIAPAGRGMPTMVTVADQAATGGQSVSRDFAIAEIPGDLNADGQVDGADLGALLSAWGPCAP